MPKVKESKAAMRLGIKLKCIDCMGHEDYIKRIRECDSGATCGIWPFRPYKPKEEGENGE